jgi:hypothetical protein
MPTLRFQESKPKWTGLEADLRDRRNGHAGHLQPRTWLPGGGPDGTHSNSISALSSNLQKCLPHKLRRGMVNLTGHPFPKLSTWTTPLPCIGATRTRWGAGSSCANEYGSLERSRWLTTTASEASGSRARGAFDSSIVPFVVANTRSDVAGGLPCLAGQDARPSLGTRECQSEE